MNIKIECKTVDELRELTHLYKMEKRDKFSVIFQDFHYFSVHDISYSYFDKSEIEYIVAIDIDNNCIVGIIKYSLELSTYYHNQDIQFGDVYTNMRYIDVREGYKGIRIGKKLIECFNNTIDKSIPVCVSAETDDGLIVGSHNMFIKGLTNTLIILIKDYIATSVDKRISKTF